MSVSALDNKNFIISQLGDDYIEAGGGEIRYQCPFCEDMGLKSSDYKFYINYSTHRRKSLKYWCHRCETAGRLKMDDILSKGSNVDVYEFLSGYMDSLGRFDEISDDEEESDYFIIPKSQPIPGTLAWDYLISRGITPVDISYYSIRSPSINDPNHFYGRIVIPNRIISNMWTDMYVGRTFINDPIRYKNPRSGKSHDLVFNLHRIEQNPNRIIINEGAINSMIAGTDSVASFGKYVSDHQLKSILAKNPESLYVSLDTDAIEQAEKLCDRIISLSDTKVYLTELPIDNDASDLGRSQYHEFLLASPRYKRKSIFIVENFIKKLSNKGE